MISCRVQLGLYDQLRLGRVVANESGWLFAIPIRRSPCQVIAARKVTPVTKSHGRIERVEAGIFHDPDSVW